jgi:hypothetical protein
MSVSIISRGRNGMDLGTGKSWVKGCEAEDTLTHP